MDNATCFSDFFSHRPFFHANWNDRFRHHHRNKIVRITMNLYQTVGPFFITKETNYVQYNSTEQDRLLQYIKKRKKKLWEACPSSFFLKKKNICSSQAALHVSVCMWCNNNFTWTLFEYFMRFINFIFNESLQQSSRVNCKLHNCFVFE